LIKVGNSFGALPVKPKRVSNYTQKDRSIAKRIKRWFKAA